MCINASFFPAILSCPFCTFSFFLFVCLFVCLFFCRFFFYFLYSFTKMKACTVCANAQAYGLMAIQSQKVQNCWTSVSDISGQVFKSGWLFFFWFKCVRNVIEKAVSTCVIILQDRKVKKFNLTISKFRAQWYEDIWPTKVGKPWIEKGDAYADMVQKDLENL